MTKFILSGVEGQNSKMTPRVILTSSAAKGKDLEILRSSRSAGLPQDDGVTVNFGFCILLFDFER